jgi:hypothetical protein
MEMSYTDSTDFDGPEGMEKVIAVLTAGHLDIYGGYPHDYEVHAGKVFIASLDDGKDRNGTQIDVYDESDLRAWEKRAHQCRKEWPKESWDTCVYETEND